VNADELIQTLTRMAEQIPDEMNAIRLRARNEGLEHAIIERLATQLIERAQACWRALGGA